MPRNPSRTRGVILMDLKARLSLSLCCTNGNSNTCDSCPTNLAAPHFVLLLLFSIRPVGALRHGDWDIGAITGGFMEGHRRRTWWGGNPGVEGSDHDQGSRRQRAARGTFLHHHSQAQSYSRDHSVPQCCCWASWVLLREVVDQFPVQARVLRQAVHEAGEHRDPDLCCSLLWPGL